ncbi:MAG: ATP-binding cassette domain-containing protein [Bacilli bacterium]|nr:ATP-binding cassette domain-containing protein [Bacilli bacterium]
MLKLSNICKIYKGSGKEAIKNVSFSLPDTGLFILSGPSGSGKTTLLNVMGGMDIPTSGKIYFDSEEINTKNYDAFRSNNVAFVFQCFNLIDDYTILDNLKIASSLAGREYDERVISEALRRVNLPDDGEPLDEFLERTPSELSGGQKQRVAIARAFLKSPRIFLFDEPSSAIDKENGRNLVELIRQLAEESLVVVSTHDKGLFDGLRYGEISLKDGLLVSSRVDVESKKHHGSPKKAIRSRVTLSEKLRYGFKAFSRHKGRFFFSFLAMLFSFSLLGSCVALASANVDEAAIVSQVNGNASRYAFFDYKKPANSGDYLVDAQLDADDISKISDQSFFPCWDIPFVLANYEDWEKEGSNLTSLYFRTAIGVNVFGDCSPEKMDLLPDERFGNPNEMRLPAKEDEVAVTDLVADFLLKHRNTYLTRFSEDVTGASGLVGKKIHIEYEAEEGRDYVITGVFSTDDPFHDYWIEHDYSGNKELANRDLRSDSLYYSTDGMSINKALFFYRGQEPFHSFMMKMPNGVGSYKALVDRIKGDLEHSGRELSFKNLYSGSGDYFRRVQVYLVPIALILGVIDAIVGLSLLGQYYSTTVKESHKTFGIMKASGAKTTTLFGMIALQLSMIVSLLFLFSGGIVALVSSLANSYFLINLIYLNLPSALTLLGFSAFSILFLSSLSFAKIKRQTPINIINE